MIWWLLENLLGLIVWKWSTFSTNNHAQEQLLLDSPTWLKSPHSFLASRCLERNSWLLPFEKFMESFCTTIKQLWRQVPTMKYQYYLYYAYISFVQILHDFADLGNVNYLVFAPTKELIMMHSQIIWSILACDVLCGSCTDQSRPWKKYRSPMTQAGLESDLQYLKKYCSFFFYWMSTVVCITVCSCWYAQIWKGQKTHCVLPPKRSRFGFPTSPNFNYMGRGWPFLTLPTLHSFYLCWKWQKESISTGQKR